MQKNCLSRKQQDWTKIQPHLLEACQHVGKYADTDADADIDTDADAYADADADAVPDPDPDPDPDQA